MIPFIYILKIYLSNLVLYGIARNELFEDILIVIKPVIGLSILLLIPKFKHSNITDTKYDFGGYLFSLIGIYMILIYSVFSESKPDTIKFIL